jgi:HlyD family secretion protein
VAEAERELERVKLQASARLVDLTADVNTNTAKYALEQEKYAKIVDQIGKATILAPVDGVVVYRRSEGGMGRSNEVIQKGTEVQERQEIMSIPQSGGMVAEASLHESVVQKVAPGMRVRLKVDAIKDREYSGEVAFVAVVPDSNSWWANPNLRQFKTTISVLDATPDMKPGMSCNVEILVDSVENALVAPVQAIYRSGGKNVCFVDGATREVTVGRSSEAWVEILDGLREGETVALAPPTGFKPEPEPDAPPPEGMPTGMPAGAPRGMPTGAAGYERPAGGAGAEATPPAGGWPQRGGERGPRGEGTEAGHGGR